MKVFISWSGETSKQIAEKLQKWIPCLLQNVKVFFSPVDIEKGENWDKKLSEILATCNYGIVCLTTENVAAPWINFEAGALAKAFDSRIACIIHDMKPSDVKGPLARYQATRIDEKDVFLLVSSINKHTDTPLDESRLKDTFDALWPKLHSVLMALPSSQDSMSPDHNEDSPIEEILQLARKIATTVSFSAESLLTKDELNLLEREKERNTVFMHEIMKWLGDFVENHAPKGSHEPRIFSEILSLTALLKRFAKKNNDSLILNFIEPIERRVALIESGGLPQANSPFMPYPYLEPQASFIPPPYLEPQEPSIHRPYIQPQTKAPLIPTPCLESQVDTSGNPPMQTQE